MPTLSQTSPSLIARLRAGNDTADWQRFYVRYQPMLMSYAKRVGLSDADAQDVVADTLADFVAGFRRGDYEPSRGRLCQWLRGIAKHRVQRILDRRGTRKRHQSSLEYLARTGAAPCSDTGTPLLDELFDLEWGLARLAASLDTLRRESHIDTYQAFDLYVLKEWSVESVARFIGVKKCVVYNAKSRCLKRLAAIMAMLREEED